MGLTFLAERLQEILPPLISHSPPLVIPTTYYDCPPLPLVFHANVISHLHTQINAAHHHSIFRMPSLLPKLAMLVNCKQQPPPCATWPAPTSALPSLLAQFSRLCTTTTTTRIGPRSGRHAFHVRYCTLVMLRNNPCCSPCHFL